MAAGARGRGLLRHYVATLEEACATRISSAVGCSRIKSGASGATMPALPVPIDPAFRAKHKSKSLPMLGADNELAKRLAAQEAPRRKK